MPDAHLTCPIHGPVDGLGLSEGPLSSCWPWVLVCEKCDPHATVVVGYEWEGGSSVRWEDAPVD